MHGALGLDDEDQIIVAEALGAPENRRRDLVIVVESQFPHHLPGRLGNIGEAFGNRIADPEIHIPGKPEHDFVESGDHAFVEPTGIIDEEIGDLAQHRHAPTLVCAGDDAVHLLDHGFGRAHRTPVPPFRDDTLRHKEFLKSEPDHTQRPLIVSF